MKKLAVEIITPIVVVALLWAWTASADSYYYPPLGDVFTAFNDTWLFERFREDVVPSVLRLAAGYVIAVVFFAAGLGLAMAFCPPGTGRRLALPAAWLLVEAFRSDFPFGGVPLSILAVGQVAGPLATIARLGGTLLLGAATVSMTLFSSTV